MAYLQKGKPGKAGGCESCGSACGCHNCRAKLPSGGLAGFGERYERDEQEEAAPPPKGDAGPRSPASSSISGWGLAFGGPSRRRRIVGRRPPGPSKRQLEEEIFRLRQQLRAVTMGRGLRAVRVGPGPPPMNQPPPDAPPPEGHMPDAAPPGPPPPESAPPEGGPADAPPPEGGTSGWYGDSPPLPDIVRVRGFRVARALAPRLAALLSAAEAAGIPLDGGRALTRESPGFRWLMQNAARFGLRNLPSEPWHWSVNGR